MNQAQLSDVQIANLTLLLTIRDSVRYDKPAACCRFALDGAQAARLGAISIQHLSGWIDTPGQNLQASAIADIEEKAPDLAIIYGSILCQPLRWVLQAP